MATKKKTAKKKAVKKRSAARKKTAPKKRVQPSKKKSSAKKSRVKKATSKAKVKSKAKAKTKTKAKAAVKSKKATQKVKKKTAKKTVAKAKAAPARKNQATSTPAKAAKPKLVKVVKLDASTLKIRDRLLQNRAEVLRMLESSQALERNVGELTFSNEIDLASSLEGREMVFQLSSRDRNELRLIEEALFKMKSGIFGVCESCSKKIGMKRLQILPLTSLCIDCQESLEVV